MRTGALRSFASLGRRLVAAAFHGVVALSLAASLLTLAPSTPVRGQLSPGPDVSVS